jgi:integrase
MARKAAPTLTESILATATAQKVGCNECTGPYAKHASDGVWTFYWRYTDPNLPKFRNQRDHRIGAYRADALNVDKAKELARHLYKNLKERGIVPVKATMTDSEHGLTVSDIVARYVAYISEEIEKQVMTEGVAYTFTEARLASWKNVATSLARFTAEFGLRTASTVTNKEIAAFLSRIDSASMANRMRSMLCNCFAWACQAKQSYLDINPVRLIEEKRRRERSDDDTQRWLRDQEVLPVWNALLDESAPGERSTRLAILLILTTGLRAKECRTARRSDFVGLDTDNPIFRVRPENVKKRRWVEQPLNRFAVRIVKLAMTATDGEVLFPSVPNGTAPVSNNGLALNVTGRPERIGVLEFMGWHTDPAKKWTPYVLRRTAATLIGDCGYDDKEVAAVLDHRTVTARYNKSNVARERLRRELQKALEAQLARCLRMPPPSITAPPLALPSPAIAA